jgi:hypothetical protein
MFDLVVAHCGKARNAKDLLARALGSCQVITTEPTFAQRGLKVVRYRKVDFTANAVRSEPLP